MPQREWDRDLFQDIVSWEPRKKELWKIMLIQLAYLIQDMICGIYKIEDNHEETSPPKHVRKEETCEWLCAQQFFIPLQLVWSCMLKV